MCDKQCVLRLSALFLNGLIAHIDNLHKYFLCFDAFPISTFPLCSAVKSYGVRGVRFPRGWSLVGAPCSGLFSANLSELNMVLSLIGTYVWFDCP